MPSILFINRVYPPDEGATGQLLAELSQALTIAGWRVTVVTSRGATGLPPSETIAGVRVERVAGLPFTRASHWRRALSYLSLYPALLWRALWLPRSEIIVTITDPPLQLLLGSVLQWFKGSRHVHWAQDVYPELAEEMGVLKKDGFLARILRRFSTSALVRCDGIIAVGRCMKARLVERGIDSSAITVIPNWGHSTNAQCPMPNAQREVACTEIPGGTPESLNADEFRAEHGLIGKFVVMYSGNLGLAHPFEAMLDAAERLQFSLPNVVLLFVGNGPRLPWVRDEVQRRQLSNVRFLPFQPLEKLAQSLAAADLHLASMRQELCGLVVPSKVYGVLAAGRPCIFLGPEESEAAQFIREHGCGSVLANATGARLAACLTQWVNDSDLLHKTRNRVDSISDRVNLAAAVDAFEDVIELATGSSKRAAQSFPEHKNSPMPSPAKVSIAP